MNHGPRRQYSKCLVTGAVVIVAAACGAHAQDVADSDAEYIKRFEERYPPVETAPSLEEYASAARYDELHMGDNLQRAIEKASNDQGGIAWGLSSWMMSVNDMYRVTRNEKYLDANLDCIRAVVRVRDDKCNVALWTGVVAPAWGSDKYAQRGRAVFGVHTGMITFPMLDFLRLVEQNTAFRQKLGEEFEEIRLCAVAALAFHDRQWREGPGPDEGHYIMLDQEDGTDGKPKPGNRLSALGRALWTSWKLSGDLVHRDRARAIGRYIRNRLTPSPDGAFYWSYWLPEQPATAPAPKEAIRGEDRSHAGLTIALPILLAQDGEIFTPEDMKRLANTVMLGLGRLGNGIILGDVTGSPASSPQYVGAPTNWLPLAQYAPEVRSRILPFYLRYRPVPSPRELAALLVDGTR